MATMSFAAYSLKRTHSAGCVSAVARRTFRFAACGFVNNWTSFLPSLSLPMSSGTRSTPQRSLRPAGSAWDSAHAMVQRQRSVAMRGRCRWAAPLCTALSNCALCAITSSACAIACRRSSGIGSQVQSQTNAGPSSIA